MGYYCCLRQARWRSHPVTVQLRDNIPADETEKSGSGNNVSRKHHKDLSIDQSQLNTVLSPGLRDLRNEAVATSFQDIDPESGEVVFVVRKGARMARLDTRCGHYRPDDPLLQ
jgi:hypothetical protein